MPALLVDQGDADQFLAEQLRPNLLAGACTAAAEKLKRTAYEVLCKHRGMQQLRVVEQKALAGGDARQPLDLQYLHPSRSSFSVHRSRLHRISHPLLALHRPS